MLRGTSEEANGRKKRITLTTLEKADSAFDTNVISLEVSDIYDDKAISPPVVYFKRTLPINMENIVTYEDITTWPHLRGLDLPWQILTR